MNILYITQLLPYPLNAGGKIKTYSTLRALSDGHRVDLVCFVSDSSDLPHASALKRKLSLRSTTALVNRLVVEKNLKQQLVLMIKSLFTRMPYSVYKFRSLKMATIIKTCVLQNPYDAVWVDHLSMAQYLPITGSVKKILECHNVEHLLYERHAKHELLVPWKIFFFIEGIKYRIYERKMYPLFDHLFAISVSDQKGMLAVCPKVKPQIVSVLPPGVPERLFSVMPHPKRPTILFVGLLTWYPNKLGVIWFIRQVFPLIRRAVPGVKLLLAGERSRRFPIINSSSVRLVGAVSSVFPYLSRASAVVVPIQFGSGIRIKILEAMAAGLPVVSTVVGAEGIPAKNGEDLFIAKNAEDFANKVILLLQNAGLRKTMGESAKTFVKNNYSQKLVELQVNRVIKHL